MDGDIFDCVIVGQGLAGTTLAWHLVEAGRSVLLLDAEAPVTASKISPGLITPITGQRLSLAWTDANDVAAAAVHGKQAIFLTKPIANPISPSSSQPADLRSD